MKIYQIFIFNVTTCIGDFLVVFLYFFSIFPIFINLLIIFLVFSQKKKKKNIFVENYYFQYIKVICASRSVAAPSKVHVVVQSVHYDSLEISCLLLSLGFFFFKHI